MDHRQEHPALGPVAPGSVAARGEPDDLPPADRPLDAARVRPLGTGRGRSKTESGTILVIDDERGSADVAVLGFGEGFQEWVGRLPAIEPPGTLKRRLGADDLADSQPSIESARPSLRVSPGLR